MWLLVKKKTRW